MRPEPVEGARFDKLSEHYTGGTPWRRVEMRPEPVEGARFDKLSEHYTGGTPWRRVEKCRSLVAAAAKRAVNSRRTSPGSTIASTI